MEWDFTKFFGILASYNMYSYNYTFFFLIIIQWHCSKYTGL